MHAYTITLYVQTQRALTEQQEETMSREVLRAIDEEANLPLDADVITATTKKD